MAFNRQRKLSNLMNIVDTDTTSNVVILNNVAIGGTTTTSYKLDVTGTGRATVDFIVTSDARVKKNIVDIPEALGKVLRLRGVNFNRIDIEDTSLKMGVIAQEVEKVVPEVVYTDKAGDYAVAYGSLIGLLIEAIKDQQKQIDELKLQQVELL